jgi:hypothetical protein
MKMAALLLLALSVTVLAVPVRADVADVRGGGAAQRTWEVGFWEFGVGTFDTIRFDWVSGQFLGPPYVANFDVDGTYGEPYGPDGWKAISGDQHSAVVACSTPADWLAFDLVFKDPEAATTWVLSAYEGNTLKDLELMIFDATSWRFEPIGACCAPDGSCSLRTQPACTELQGAWLGKAVQCTPTGCQQTPVEPMSWGKIKSLYR